MQMKIRFEQNSNRFVHFSLLEASLLLQDLRYVPSIAYLYLRMGLLTESQNERSQSHHVSQHRSLMSAVVLKRVKPHTSVFIFSVGVVAVLPARASSNRAVLSRCRVSTLMSDFKPSGFY